MFLVALPSPPPCPMPFCPRLFPKLEFREAIPSPLKRPLSAMPHMGDIHHVEVSLKLCPTHSKPCLCVKRTRALAVSCALFPHQTLTDTLMRYSSSLLTSLGFG